VIVRYTTPSVSVTPINSFFVNGTTPISATATVYGDSPPFTVKFYTNSANHIYAVVVDSVNKTNTSSINTFFMVPNNLPISPYQAFCVGDVRSIFTNNVGRVYAVHQYKNTANLGYFVPSTSIKNVEMLLVGGGGGGGYRLGGGGGAGGLVWTSSTVTAQSYLVEVGKGGAGGGWITTPRWCRRQLGVQFSLCLWWWRWRWQWQWRDADDSGNDWWFWWWRVRRTGWGRHNERCCRNTRTR
jgi:hypothetical protein